MTSRISDSWSAISRPILIIQTKQKIHVEYLLLFQNLRIKKPILFSSTGVYYILYMHASARAYPRYSRGLRFNIHEIIMNAWRIHLCHVMNSSRISDAFSLWTYGEHACQEFSRFLVLANCGKFFKISRRLVHFAKKLEKLKSFVRFAKFFQIR